MKNKEFSYIYWQNFKMFLTQNTSQKPTILNDMVNELSDEEYEGWMKYHLKICGEQSILGYSNHGLYVCRKK